MPVISRIRQAYPGVRSTFLRRRIRKFIILRRALSIRLYTSCPEGWELTQFPKCEQGRLSTPT